MRDSMIDDVAARPSLAPAVRDAAGATAGAAVDLAGTRNYFRTVMLVAVAGEITDGTHTLTVEHSDNGSTGWTEVPAELHDGGALVAFDDSNGSTVQRLALRDTKRYLRAKVTVGGSPATGGVVGALFLLGSGSGRPVT